MEILAAPERLIQVGDLFEFLSGQWAVDRDISDHRLSTSGSFSGLATFSEDNGNLRYREEGQLRFADYNDTAFRQYDFVFPFPGKADVFFDDGRAFHDLDLTTGQWATHHNCGDDLYEGLFQVTADCAYGVEWTIKGPHKDLVLSTSYQKTTTKSTDHS